MVEVGRASLNSNTFGVEAKASNIFFNKKYNLIYGKFLTKMIENKTDLKIICYKKPYYIHKVNYSDIVDELNETMLSDDIEEDKSNKKKNSKYHLWNAREVQ
jgi:hypothetical protein